jgi:hypothetical protein
LLRRRPFCARLRFPLRLRFSLRFSLRFPFRFPLRFPLRLRLRLRRPLRLPTPLCLLRLNVPRDRCRRGDGAIVPAELDGGIGAGAGDGTEAVALPRDSSVARRVLG